MAPFPFDPAPRSRIRERLLLKQLERLGREPGLALKARPDALFPGTEGYSPPSGNLRAAMVQLRNQLTLVEQQNAAARADETRFRKLTALEQRAEVGEFLHRSTRDRSTAIAGVLERERRRFAPLTRDAFLRAQATAAARRRLEEALFFHRGGHRAASKKSLFAGSYAGVDVDYNPCIDQVKRREVMFADGTAGRGWRSRKRYQIGC